MTQPSRTALMIARQRAAHQALDRGSILDDPFAIRILREDEKDGAPDSFGMSFCFAGKTPGRFA